MARGQRTNLASLAGLVGEHSPVDQAGNGHAQPSAAVLSELTANPRNPRDDLGDLDDLASIVDIQLQPAVVVSRTAYQRLYPEDAIATRWVVINGCRRLAAAHRYGRTDLEIIVKDELARDRITLLTAAISENVDRVDFDVIEEARAVEALARECGSAGEAARRLRKTDGWVSQRRKLLSLAPELQQKLRAGELALRAARSLAHVPLERQVAAWQARQDRARSGPAGEKTGEHSRGETPAGMITKALRSFESRPDQLAEALHTVLGEQGVKTLVAALEQVGDRTAVPAESLSAAA